MTVSDEDKTDQEKIAYISQVLDNAQHFSDEQLSSMLHYLESSMPPRLALETSWHSKQLKKLLTDTKRPHDQTRTQLTEDYSEYKFEPSTAVRLGSHKTKTPVTKMHWDEAKIEGLPGPYSELEKKLEMVRNRLEKRVDRSSVVDGPYTQLDLKLKIVRERLEGQIRNAEVGDGSKAQSSYGVKAHGEDKSRGS